MLNKKPESCPKLYECSMIRMAPMIKAFLRCTVEEAMESICASCDEKPEVQEVGQRKRGITQQEKLV